MHDLAALLDIPLYAAGGLLEFLWQWAPRYAIRGDIGRRSNANIAHGIHWDGDPDALVRALVNSRWVDEAPEPFRLVVHDVADHADNTWRQCLVDAGLTWWNGAPPRRERLGRPIGNSSKTTVKLQRNSSKTPQPEPEPEPTVVVLPELETVDRQAAACEPRGIVGSPPPANGNHANAVSPAAIAAHVRQLLLEYPGSKSLRGQPDAAIIGKSLYAARGSMEILCEALMAMSRAGKVATKSWAYFPPVIAAEVERLSPLTACWRGGKVAV